MNLRWMLLPLQAGLLKAFQAQGIATRPLSEGALALEPLRPGEKLL